MATPAVSGGVALMLQKDATLTPDTVKARLMKTAYKKLPPVSVAQDPTTEPRNPELGSLGKFCSPCPIPGRRGLTGRAALHLGYILFY
jgi:hypothetical protein